jgi:hypothetical protein
VAPLASTMKATLGSVEIPVTTRDAMASMLFGSPRYV